MKGLEKNKGITLVALVVTIIVLIILAGVSISLVLGQDGVVQKAKAGRDNYAEAARLENEQLANVDAFAMNIEAMIPSSPSDNQGTVTGTITNVTGGDLEISATVSLSANTNLERTKYVFTTSSSALGTNDESLYKDGTIEQANGTVKATKKSGTYYLHVLATDTNGGKTEIISEQTATSQGKKNFDYTGNVQNISLTPGNYKLEVWGAQGGNGKANSSYYDGGYGGYSKGNINLESNLNMYIYVGGQGKTPETTGDSSQYAGTNGYNGGGNSVYWSNTSYASSGGGGSTDIRIEQDSLYARVIVAGGGGGSGFGQAGAHQRNSYAYGGGSSGGNGYAPNYTSGSGATQSSGASFGIGGNASTGKCGAGGGGGWYGGYGANDYASGGGGSGWIFTESTYNTWRNGNATDANQYLLKNHTEYYLTDAQTTAGNTSFTSPTGSNETGHAGNGYARITAID